MRYLVISCLAVSLYPSYGCCHSSSTQPSRPTDIGWWKGNSVEVGKAICYLILNEGESSQNKELGVKVLQVISPDQCAEPNTFSGKPRVELSIHKIIDDQEICRITVLAGGYTSLQSDSFCGKNDLFSGITVNKINTKDKWVEFSLIK